MLEAVNSVVSNASLLRGQAEQTSAARSLAANPERVQVVPQAPYISPYIHVDVNFDTAVLALRDRDTGDFLTTIPSDARLQARAQDEAKRALADAQIENSAVRNASVRPQAQPVAAPQPETQAAPQTPAASAASFGAFAKQVASLQTAIAGGGTGGTVSVTA